MVTEADFAAASHLAVRWRKTSKRPISERVPLQLAPAVN